ncbi:hypothetical protein QBC39DRAFT_187931 [Podospora conica]|nr:hypothetical protein QBC39DRAFT_187931 [Schizothecium conicum]
MGRSTTDPRRFRRLCGPLQLGLTFPLSLYNFNFCCFSTLGHFPLLADLRHMTLGHTWSKHTKWSSRWGNGTVYLDSSRGAPRNRWRRMSVWKRAGYQVSRQAYSGSESELGVGNVYFLMAVEVFACRLARMVASQVLPVLPMSPKYRHICQESRLKHQGPRSNRHGYRASAAKATRSSIAMQPRMPAGQKRMNIDRSLQQTCR